MRFSFSSEFKWLNFSPFQNGKTWQNISFARFLKMRSGTSHNLCWILAWSRPWRVSTDSFGSSHGMICWMGSETPGIWSWTSVRGNTRGPLAVLVFLFLLSSMYRTWSFQTHLYSCTHSHISLNSERLNRLICAMNSLLIAVCTLSR